MRGGAKTRQSPIAHLALLSLGVALFFVSRPARAEPGDKHWMWGTGFGIMHADPSVGSNSSLFGFHSHSSPTWELTSKTRLGFHLDYLMGGGTRAGRGDEPPQSVFHFTFQLGPTFEYRAGTFLLGLNSGYHFGLSSDASGPQFGIELGTWRPYLAEVRGQEHRGELGSSVWLSYGPLIDGGWAVLGGSRFNIGQ
jgi:hypothetical protein